MIWVKLGEVILSHFTFLTQKEILKSIDISQIFQFLFPSKGQGEAFTLLFYYRPQRSWAKVIFSQACVKNSVHGGGGCLPQCMLGYTPPPRPGTPSRPGTPPGPGTPSQEQTPPRDQAPPRDQTPLPRPGRPPPGSRLQHTVNERPVRILLECILVNEMNFVSCHNLQNQTLWIRIRWIFVY